MMVQQISVDISKAVPNCSNHDLNLALCHTCNDVLEIRNMLSSITELGLFFKYSPKRTMLLESIIDEENKKRNRKKKIPVQKVKVFCETRFRDMWY